ncbi:MAG: guanylate kinase, partial [Anaeroplasmataceae bacterium]|nr:guanylate kinase [Anaeroplasmataceae bacterium]
MKLNDRGLLVVISGPSGVGKGTVRKALFNMPNNNLVYSVSMTTRPKRASEQEGIDYFFVSKEEFLERKKQQKFLETAEFVGNYYGTPLDMSLIHL